MEEEEIRPKMSVDEAAMVIGKNSQYIRYGLRAKRLDYGSAVKIGVKNWTYHIAPEKLCQCEGITMEEARRRIEAYKARTKRRKENVVLN